MTNNYNSETLTGTTSDSSKILTLPVLSGTEKRSQYSTRQEKNSYFKTEALNNLLKYYGIPTERSNELLKVYSSFGINDELYYGIIWERVLELQKMLDGKIENNKFVQTLYDAMNKGLVHPTIFAPESWNKFLESQSSEWSTVEEFKKALKKVLTGAKETVVGGVGGVGEALGEFFKKFFSLEIVVVVVLFIVIVYVWKK